MELSDSLIRTAGRLFITARTRQAMRRLCRAQGRQALLLAWPKGACYLPLSLYSPGQFDVIIGHVARCPIYVDVRQFELYAAERALLDLAEPVRMQRRPLLKLRSVHEGQRPSARPRTTSMAWSRSRYQDAAVRTRRVTH